MKNIKRTISIALALFVTAGSTGIAAEVPKASIAQSTASTVQSITSNIKSAYLREDIRVEYNREVLTFADEKGNTVYPITYGGSTYLPIRAVSGLMGEPIEWISRAKTIYIGKTLTKPMKTITDNHDSPYVNFITLDEDGNMPEGTVLPGTGGRTVIAVREQQNVLVMYDFESLTFKNENGDIIYPVNFNGSNYLPLRSIAELMNEEIIWDSKTKTIYIGSTEIVDEKESEKTRDEIIAIRELFNKEAEVYNLATANISGIAGWTNETAPVMAAAISENLASAQEIKKEAAELLKTKTFTEEELAAAERLHEFTEITEYYILVMENIAYMQAQNQDYSMLAETFLDFALASDRAMDNALKAIQALK